MHAYEITGAGENNSIQMGPHAQRLVEKLRRAHEEHVLLKELIKSVFQKNERSHDDEVRVAEVDTEIVPLNR